MTRPLRLTSALLSIVLSIVLGACAASDEPNAAAEDVAAEAASTRPAVAPLLRAMLEPSHPDAAEDAIASLPPATVRASEPVRNRHDPELFDTVHRLTFDGLTIVVYDVGDTGKRLLAAVIVERPGAGSDGLRVGLPVTDVLARLGRPDREAPEELVYRLTPAGKAPHTLTVATAGGAVEALTWSAYLD